MKTETTTRAFNYQSVDLTDPNPDFTPEQVREFYATIYPEILSAAIEGPEPVGSKLVYTFARAVGTKGNKPFIVNIEAEMGTGANAKITDADGEIINGVTRLQVNLDARNITTATIHFVPRKVLIASAQSRVSFAQLNAMADAMGYDLRKKK
jgi:PRTRC genetic system protein C